MKGRHVDTVRERERERELTYTENTVVTHSRVAVILYSEDKNNHSRKVCI